MAGSDVAPGPVTRTRDVFASGSRLRSFLSSVTASSAAARLTTRNAGAPTFASMAGSASAFSNRPSANRRPERGEEILSELALGDPRGRAIVATEGHAVAEVVLGRRSHEDVATDGRCRRPAGA